MGPAGTAFGGRQEAMLLPVPARNVPRRILRWLWFAIFVPALPRQDRVPLRGMRLDHRFGQQLIGMQSFGEIPDGRHHENFIDLVTSLDILKLLPDCFPRSVDNVAIVGCDAAFLRGLAEEFLGGFPGKHRQRPAAVHLDPEDLYLGSIALGFLISIRHHHRQCHLQ